MAKMLSTGEILETVTGRKTTPVPIVNTSSVVKTNNSLKRIDKWLVKNAIEEAKARDDDFNLVQFQGMNVKKITPAERDGLNLYLFDQI